MFYFNFEFKMTICEEWKNNKLVNPRTNRKISPQGRVYKKLEIECSSKSQIRKKSPVKRRPRSCSRSPKKTCSRLPSCSRSRTRKSWFEDRIQKSLKINDFITSIDTEQWSMCMSGSNSKEFRKNFKTVTKIGCGSYGEVYKVSLKDSEEQFVVKEARFSNKDSLQKIERSPKRWEEMNANTFPNEKKLLDLVKELILLGKCPNFVLTYNIAYCDGCIFSKLPTKCYVTFMEALNSDLCRVKLGGKQQLSILYQLLIAVHAIHSNYGIWHRDIKKSNILIQMIEPGGHFEYVIDGISYFVENTGIVVFIADFGVSESLFPKYSWTGYYGTRNAEVKGLKNPYLDPLFIPGMPLLKWAGSNAIASDNIGHYEKSKKRIALNNSSKFPPFEFFGDIQDVFRMFVGGSQTEQPGWHEGIRPLDSDVRKLIKTNKIIVKSIDLIYKNKNLYETVKYVVAKEMLKEIYTGPSIVGSIVSRFTM
jgi:serine/threonine protein kinase